VQRFGVEGSGTFAAGLLRFLQANGQEQSTPNFAAGGDEAATSAAVEGQ
jgi:hypothetical protein